MDVLGFEIEDSSKPTTAPDKTNKETSNTKQKNNTNDEERKTSRTGSKTFNSKYSSINRQFEYGKP